MNPIRLAKSALQSDFSSTEIVDQGLKLTLKNILPLYHKQIARYKFNPDGESIFNREWDNLVILDGCRYDAFEKVVGSNEFKKINKFNSLGTHTTEFLRGNLNGRDLNDTIYITANPQLSHLQSNENEFSTNLYSQIDVWDSSSWDKELGTVPPEKMAEKTLEVYRENPHKRLIIHFIQPHYPFIGEFGRKKFGEISLDNPFWIQVDSNHIDVSEQDIWKAYLENLELSIPYVKDAIDVIGGKSVVTSDHGGLFNDYLEPLPIKSYGHPVGLYTNELTHVPWVECEYDERRNIIAGDSKRTDDTSSNIGDRLESLGYI
jgi:hypothetical protein